MFSVFLKREKPKAKFYSGDRVVITLGTLVIESKYWVEWSQDIWHVDIVSVADTEDKDRGYSVAQVKEVVSEALRGKKERTILISGAEKRSD